MRALFGRIAVTASIIIASTAASPEAVADEPSSGAAGDQKVRPEVRHDKPRVAPLAIAMWLLEAAFPDIRAEWADGEVDPVLSWPLHLWRRTATERVVLAGFVEPQIAFGEQTEYRLLGGGRTEVWPLAISPRLGPVLEAGGVLGSEQSGAFVGGGIAWDVYDGADEHPRHGVPTVSLIYRRTFTEDGQRNDIVLDAVAFDLYFIFIGGKR